MKHRGSEPKESQIPYLAVELEIIQVREQALELLGFLMSVLRITC